MILPTKPEIICSWLVALMDSGDSLDIPLALQLHGFFNSDCSHHNKIGSGFVLPVRATVKALSSQSLSSLLTFLLFLHRIT